MCYFTGNILRYVYGQLVTLYNLSAINADSYGIHLLRVLQHQGDRTYSCKACAGLVAH